MYYFSKRSKEKINELHPLLQKILFRSIEDSPEDFGIHEGHRPIEKQHEAFEKGLSQIDGINKRGYHNYKPALAFDFHATGPNIWDEKKLKIVADHILKVAKDEFGTKLTWGGVWKTIHDFDHIQLPYCYKKEAEKDKLY